MWKTITWQQVAIVTVMCAATITAYKLLGEGAGAALGSITTIVAFLAGRPADAGQP